MASSSDPPKQNVDISNPSYNVVGFDTIWYNVDSRSDFSIYRTWGHEIKDILILVADRVRHDIFEVVSLNATKHMVVVTISTPKSARELMEKWLDRDYLIGEKGLDVEQ